MARFSKTLLIAALGATALTSPAFAKTEVHPHIEVGQVLSTDLQGGDPSVLTYSTVGGGVDATVSTRNIELNASYRYERRIAWKKDVGDEDIHSGLVRGRYMLVPDTLSFEAGALATRARSDIRGSAPIGDVGNVNNVTQVYSAYAGPSFANKVGPVDVTAAYRFGYTSAKAPSDPILLPAGQRAQDNYDHSYTHNATASFGMEPGLLPFGWSVSGGYEAERGAQLDQRYDGKYIRGDVTMPVGNSLSLVGGVGYERTKVSQRDALLDVNGNPVVDARGRFKVDPASPVRLAYDMDELYWDAGVLWRPSERTTLEARVGRRYGTMSYTGALSWQVDDNSGLQVAAYDEVQTFGQELGNNLSQMPINFRAARNNSLTDSFSGCTFGGTGGGCLNNAFQSISTAAYRSRGVVGIYSTTRGRMTLGAGLGFNQRKYLTPSIAGQPSLNGVTDRSWFAQANADYALTENSSLSADFYTQYFQPGNGSGNTLSSGITGTYSHQFGRSLSAAASMGIYSQKTDNVGKKTNLSASAGLQYSF